MNTFKINDVRFYFTKSNQSKHFPDNRFDYSKYHIFESKEKVYVITRDLQIKKFIEGYFIRVYGRKIHCMIICDNDFYEIGKNNKFYCSTDYDYLVKKADSIKYLS